MKKFVSVLCICMLIVSKPVSAQDIEYPGGKGWHPSEPQYNAELVKNVFIPMEDGIQLEAKVSYPVDKKTGKRSTEKFPVLVEMTPYDGEGEKERLPYDYFTEHGYITVLVHPRGSGKSTGINQQFSSRDGLDGKNVVNWAAKLPESNGKVGFYGASYPGGEALCTATQVGKNSPLKAVIAASIGLDAQLRQAYTSNGLPNNLMMGYVPQAQQNMGNNKQAGDSFSEFRDEFWAGGNSAYDLDYWQDRIPLKWTQNIVDNEIPVLQWGGWSDLNETGAVRGYTAFQNAVSGRNIWGPMAHDQKASPRYQLVVGNWSHGTGMDIAIWLEWFETWIKGVDTGLQDVTHPMHLYEVGADKWSNFDVYPITDQYTSWYLGSKGNLSQKTASAGKQTLRYAKPDEADGRLQYDSEILPNGMTIAGPVSMDIYAQSSNKNMVFIARLYDVDAEGNQVMITKGAVVGSLSHLNKEASWVDKNGVSIWPYVQLDKDIYFTPQTTQHLQMPLEPIQYGVKPGHKIRVILTTQSLGNDNPQDFMGNMADPSGNLTTPQEQTLPGGVYTLLSGGTTKTAINLPQLPYGSLPTTRSAVSPTNWSENMRTFDPSGYTLPRQW